jgi:hypothetical protein
MISLNVTYYNDFELLKWWYTTVKRLENEGYEFILNIGDDGSMKNPAVDFFEKNEPTQHMRLFRVVDDIGFNSHGTRNLLMKQTTTDWNLMSDIDRQYPDKTLKMINVCEDDLTKGSYYSFYEIKEASPDRFSLNDYLVHHYDFWETGGYDEEFVNIHWGDRYFLETLTRVAKRNKMEYWDVRYVRGARNVSWEEVPFTIYPDDKTLIHPLGAWGDETFRHRLKKFVRDRNKTAKGRKSKQVLNFEWTQIF